MVSNRVNVGLITFIHHLYRGQLIQVIPQLFQCTVIHPAIIIPQDGGTPLQRQHFMVVLSHYSPFQLPLPMFMAKGLVRPGRLGPVGLLPCFTDVLTLTVFLMSCADLLLPEVPARCCLLTFCANICSWILKNKIQYALIIRFALRFTRGFDIVF